MLTQTAITLTICLPQSGKAKAKGNTPPGDGRVRVR